ncbi:MAG TPA: DUF835 domain-containing protein [Thermoplasmata archaeon]|nr:DUF835 domain-containing protein [Thermoplasmata archaeon]
MVALGVALSLAALGVSAFLAVYVLGLNPRGSANRAFFILMLAFVLWDAAEAAERAHPLDAPASALVPYADAVWLGIALVPAALIHLAVAYPQPSRWLRGPWAHLAIYAPSAVWAYAILRTDLVIAGVSSNAFGPSARVAETYGFVAPIYAAWLYLGVGLFVLAWRKSRENGMSTMQAVVAAGLLLGAVPAGITEAFWPLLSGADTRLGFGSLYTLTWSVFIAYAVARYRYLEIVPVMEAQPPRAVRHGLERGLNYLVVEGGRSTAMGAFREIVSKVPGLCVTGLPRSRVVARFGLERTPVLWITALTSGELTVRASALEFELQHSVTKFLRENPGTAVLLDDLDYLAALNGFEAVARFVRRVTNQASASGGTAILAVGQGTLPADQLAVLRGAVDHVLEVLRGPAEVAAGEGPVALLVGPQEAPDALATAGARGGLLLTMEHPAKARRRFGPAFEVVWIAEGGESDAPRVPPGSLDAELKRALVQYVAGHRGSDVVLVGLEQLALYNEFRAIVAFVKDAVDLATVGGCRLFVTVAPEALDSRDLAMLLRRFDAPTPAAGLRRSAPPAGPSTAGPESRILYRGPVS